MSDNQSRNVWIKIDNPLGPNTLAKYKDIYEDVLDERRHTSDIKFCLKNHENVPKFKYNNERTSPEIKDYVLKSDRVRYAIEMVCKEKKLDKASVEKEADEILNEMAHNFNMGSIRFFAFFMVKVFKSLFRRIYVNADGIQQLRELIKEYPVLFLPTHRSYFDFLLISYVCYEYEIPLPAIAAAMDFSNMKFFGWLLRQCGAFYIRRSFGTDKLYWAIFTEYVQNHIRNGDRPMEFFVEGTRSRTAKSYVPKIGMLSATLESYFKAEVSDIMLVPISISYEKILEESLYAFELLGIPKPKESTSGLFKARNVLKTDHGTVHFHIGSPISIRQWSVQENLDRIVHSLEPRYINNLTDSENELSKKLAYHLVLEQQKMLVLSPWTLIATVLIQAKGGMVHIKELCKEVDWLKRQLFNLGAYIDWPANVPVEKVVEHYANLHSNIVRVRADGIFEIVLQNTVKHGKKLLQDEVMLNAATNVMLSTYRNQLMHVIVRVCLVSVIVNSCQSNSLKMVDMLEQYAFLEQLLSREFIFIAGKTKEDFNNAVVWLQHVGALHIEDGEGNIKFSLNKHIAFFSAVLEPFLISYWVLCQHLLSLPVDVHGRALAKKHKEIAIDAQHLGLKLLQDSVIKNHEILNLDMLSNGLHSLIDMGTMYKDKRIEENYVSPNHRLVSNIATKLATLVETPSWTQIGNYTNKPIAQSLSSKL